MIGSGTVSNPYIIRTQEDLQAISLDISAHYELGNNIEFTPDYTNGNFTPIHYFIGVLDGKGYVIKHLNVFDANNGVGLIRENQGTIRNLGLENINIRGSGRWGGAIAGVHSGGLIENCWASGSVTAENVRSTSQIYYGGLAGRSSGDIRNSWSSCFVRAYDYSGGFVGEQYGGTISNSYSTGMVSNRVVTIYGNYAAFAPRRSGTLINCYYNTETSNWTTDIRAIGLTTETMQQQSSFSGWDFEDIWYMDGYPKQQVFDNPVSPPKIATVEVGSFISTIRSDVSMGKKTTEYLKTHTNSLLSYVLKSQKRAEAVISYVDKFHSYSLQFKKKMENLKAHMSNLSSNLFLSKRATKVFDSYTGRVSTAVSKSVKTLFDLHSYLAPIRVTQTISKKTAKHLHNFLNSIIGGLDNTKKKENRTQSFLSSFQSENTTQKRKFQNALSYVATITSYSKLRVLAQRLIQVASSIAPIQASVNLFKRKKNTVKSHIRPIKTFMHRFNKRFIQSKGYSKSLTGNLALIKKKMQNSISHMKTLYSTVSIKRLLHVASDMLKASSSAIRYISTIVNIKTHTQSFASRIFKENKMIGKLKSWSDKITATLKTVGNRFIAKPVKVDIRYEVHHSKVKMKYHSSEQELKESIIQLDTNFHDSLSEIKHHDTKTKTI